MNIKISKNIFLNSDSRPIIIAEISGNHCGKKGLFLRHIVEAKKAGADMVKIQTYEPEDLTIRSFKNNFRIKSGIWKNQSLWDLYEKAQTPFEWHYDAFKLAKKIKIPLFSTPFSNRSLEFLEKFKPPVYKISSFEITDYKLLQDIAKKGKPVILSTGLSTIKEIQNAIQIIEKYNKKIIILYCVSGYPTPENEANISTINLFKKKFKNNIIGVSDHTNDINSSLAAVSLGAKIIEKHFKISNKINSFDSKFSITPAQLTDLKKKSYGMWVSLGEPSKDLKPSEKKSLVFRRSIYALKNIEKNSIITEKNIITKRPNIGLNANFYFKILGKKVKKKIKKNEPIYSSFLS